jgi:hypothetical protein
VVLGRAIRQLLHKWGVVLWGNEMQCGSRAPTTQTLQLALGFSLHRHVAIEMAMVVKSGRAKEEFILIFTSQMEGAFPISIGMGVFFLKRTRCFTSPSCAHIPRMR